MSYFVEEINKNDIKKIMSIHDHYFDENIKQRHSITSVDTSDADLLLNFSSNLLQKYNLSSSVEKYSIIEYHQINVNDGPIENLLGVHTDDTNGTCNTVIFYTHVDKLIEKGELLIYNHNGFDYVSEDEIPSDIIDVKSSSDDKIKVIIMTGNIWHKPNITEGFGNRCCFVVQHMVDEHYVT